MSFRSRWCRLFLVAVVALLLATPAGADAPNCANCWSDCSFFTTFWVFCIPADLGTVGYCQCKERPCYTTGAFCSIIWVTP